MSTYKVWIVAQCVEAWQWEHWQQALLYTSLNNIVLVIRTGLGQKEN